MGILCATGDGAVFPPFAGQGGFVAEFLDADPDRHPPATTNLFSQPSGLVVQLEETESGRDLTWAVRVHESAGQALQTRSTSGARRMPAASRHACCVFNRLLDRDLGLLYVHHRTRWSVFSVLSFFFLSYNTRYTI